MQIVCILFANCLHLFAFCLHTEFYAFFLTYGFLLFRDFITFTSQNYGCFEFHTRERGGNLSSIHIPLTINTFAPNFPSFFHCSKWKTASSIRPKRPFFPSYRNYSFRNYTFLSFTYIIALENNEQKGFDCTGALLRLY